MLRPATPLTILLFAAFALLLISVLSTPIIKAIPLATFSGVDFGVFGFCKGGSCTNVEIGYDTANLFTTSEASTFDLPVSTRATLSAILIVHPIAALFTLIMLVLAAAAHFHSPSHSPRYLLGIFILSILTLILALLSFLIDVLLFVPHMAWGSYLVLAATILIAASGIVSCAMRRTLVSRKARKRRIAENAEMNGENFYNREGRPNPLEPTTSNNMVNGGPGTDKLPVFATFEMGKKDSERTSDERIPLTTRSPTEPSPTNPADSSFGSTEQFRTPSRSNTSPPRPVRVDQFGNPMPQPPPGAYSRDPSRDPSLNRQYSDPSMRGRGMSPAGYRGRGGYGPPPGRGGYGPPNGRGGYGPPRGGYGPPRGGYGAPMRGGRGGAPPGYNNPPPPQNFNRGMSPADYGRRPSPAQAGGYNAAYAVPPPAVSTQEYAAYNPDDSRSSLPRAESPPPLPEPEGPVGQAVEMDATTGSPSHAPKSFGQFGPIRESDGDVAGMVGLQQQLQQQRMNPRATVASETSRYSTDEYIPPRQAWGTGAQGRSSPLSSVPQATELPSPTHAPNRRESSDNYYEDVDPRFADNPSNTNSLIPAALSTGYPANNSSGNLQAVGGLDGSYEDLQAGQRSPAESDRSNFTSVSQRGINPRWQPGQGYGPPMPNRRPTNPPQQQRDLLLNSNPDFMLPGNRGGRVGQQGRGGRAPGPIPGMVPNSAYPGV
ncbi:SUR7/PalI family-domain-containing protein [Tricladium varicosporioides]|nr:SUR7/PalI family-domain-containing protein [Hymenoscyphus varicosporioides]